MIKRIFIDVDDTLNSLTMFILGKVFNLNIRPYDYNKFPCPGEYDIVKACSILTEREWTSDEFWESIPEWCWAEAPLSKEFNLILDFAQELVPRNRIFIATSNTLNHKCDVDCASGKMKWIQTSLPIWLQGQFFITPNKIELAASNGDLIIDDNNELCRGFVGRGGRAVIVPRPWNSYYENNTETFLRYCFDKLISDRNQEVALTGMELI